MMRGFKPIGERPTGKRVLRRVKLSDGKVIEFEVFVADPPVDQFFDNKVQAKTAVDHDGYGRVPRRGSRS
jgi:hypothetical protein